MAPESNENEVFDTGLRKIRLELKTQLATHGLYGTLTESSTEATSDPATPAAAQIEVSVKGRVARRSFGRQQIEGCHLRVNAAVLREIVSIVEELKPEAP